MILVRAQVYFGFIQRGVFVTIGSKSIYLLTFATAKTAALVSTLSVFRLRKFAKVLGCGQGPSRALSAPAQEVAESTSHTILPRNGLDKQKRGERCTCTTAKPQGR